IPATPLKILTSRNSSKATGTIQMKSGAVTRPTPNIMATSRRLGRENKTNNATLRSCALTLARAAGPKYGSNTDAVEISPETTKTRQNATRASVVKKMTFRSRIIWSRPRFLLLRSAVVGCFHHGIASPTPGAANSRTLLEGRLQKNSVLRVPLRQDLLLLVFAPVGGGRRRARKRGDLGAQRRAHLDLHRVERGLELLDVPRADDRRGHRRMRRHPGDRGAHRVQSVAAAEGDEFRRDLVHPGLAVARLIHLVRDEAPALLLKIFTGEQAHGARAVRHDRDVVGARHRQ